MSIPKSQEAVRIRKEIALNMIQQHNLQPSQVANYLGVTTQTIKNYNQPTVSTCHKKRGPKTKMTDEIKEFVEVSTVCDRRSTSSSLANEIKEKYQVNTSRQTVDRVRAELGFSFEYPLPSVMLSDTNRQDRIQFCQEKVDWKDEWNKVVFSDESFFQLASNSSKLWRKPKELGDDVRYHKRAFPPKILVWGAIGIGFKSKLIILECSINSKVYINTILKGSQVFEEANLHFKDGFIFQQDNAPSHRSTVTKDFLTRSNINVMKWPPYSPDLNVIEIIWAIMKMRIRQKKVKTLDELKDVVQKVWDDLDYETIEKLITSMPTRCKDVIQNQGRTIVGHLKKHN